MEFGLSERTRKGAGGRPILDGSPLRLKIICLNSSLETEQKSPQFPPTGMFSGVAP